MSNVVEYTLALKDLMSSPLHKLSGGVHRVLQGFSSMQNKLNSTRGAMTTTGSSISELRNKISHLQQTRDLLPSNSLNQIRSVNKEIGQLNNRIQNLSTTTQGGLKGAFSNAFNSLPFASMLTNPLMIAVGGLGATLREGFMAEKSKISFDVLLGNEEQAKKMLAGIRDFGAATPYQTADLEENAKTMLAFGISHEKVVDNLKMLGDVAMGDATKMSSLTQAFAKVNSMGKMTGLEWKQMIYAGFNPLKELSVMTGKTMEQLQEDMGKGQISAQMLNAAFKHATAQGGQFYGMTDKLSRSAFGLWSTIKDNVSKAFIELFEIIGPLVKKTLEIMLQGLHIVIAGIQRLKAGIEVMSEVFQKGIALFEKGNVGLELLAVTVGALTVSLGVYKASLMAVWLWQKLVVGITTLWSGVQAILNGILYASPITWIVAVIVGLAAAIAYVIYKTDGLGDTFKAVFAWMWNVAQSFGLKFKLGALKIQNTFMSIIEKVALAWAKLQALWDKEASIKVVQQVEQMRSAREKSIANYDEKINALKEERKNMKLNHLSWNSDRKLSDLVSGLKSKLGIASKKEQVQAKAATPSGGMHLPVDSLAGAKSVASGGTRNTSIYITLDNLVENLVFEGGYDGNKEEVQKELETMLLRVLNMASTAV